MIVMTHKHTQTFQISLLDHGPFGQKIELAQKMHASRGWCEMHANQA